MFLRGTGLAIWGLAISFCLLGSWELVLGSPQDTLMIAVLLSLQMKFLGTTRSTGNQGAFAFRALGNLVYN